ncbi:ABC transporter ATP-binding protein [Anaerocolumna xylanovorans]|uniref:ABC-type multidrug transport system, ATPase and permease component n=1 Tax=Anaerocolumna xylanovorans DSM 12503 TaxID=1121345 RepID=A0A1M7Y8Z8_9FIRM|nr:ABC transporter ATP-binding protein [Anaerocolumna xylanovorans]SHO49100.1 ABC-type multidrug transport system, ATPase and permease component [Anaerocolumna xylanovorans DSM 12503]
MIKKKGVYSQFLKKFACKKQLFPIYILLVFIIVVNAAISLIRPQMQGDIVDDLSAPANVKVSSFFVMLIIFLGMLLFSYTITYIQMYITSMISEKIAADMRQSIHDKLGTVQAEFFRKVELSNLLLKVDKDVTAIKQCGVTSIITLISNVVILVVVPPYMLSIHKGIALTNIALLVSVPVISRLLGNLIQETSERVLQGYNDTTSVLTETYNNWFTIRICNCYKYINDKYYKQNQVYKKETNKQNLLYIINKWIVLLIQFLGTLIIWGVGAKEIFDGNMTVGTIMALMNYQSIIMNPIIGISSFANEYHTAIVSLRDVNDLLEYTDIENNKFSISQKIESIEIRNLDFRYADIDKKVFSNVNFKFKQGSIYAIHGESGQGKSTLFSLLSGILQPTSGNILINGRPINTLNLQNYWDKIGVVMQRSQFFKDSLWNNINLFGMESKNRIEYLSECLGLYEDIELLPEKWDTEIKTEPYNFSEGQLRRLDVLRNILKEADILIFDEATANIDEARRKNFYNLIHTLSKEKIILFATHNPNELAEADEVIYLSGLKGEG